MRKGDHLMNRKIVLFIATSVDGFIAKEDDDLQWLLESEGEGDNGYMDMYQTIDTIIMGKRTYDYVMEHSDAFPYSDKKCYVFSKSAKNKNDDVEFVNENVVSFTQQLKKQSGAHIWMVGGAEILDAFMKENLIDEYIITITPHILGSGIALFKKDNPQINLELIKTTCYGQMVQMHYQVKQES